MNFYVFLPCCLFLLSFKKNQNIHIFPSLRRNAPFKFCDFLADDVERHFRNDLARTSARRRHPSLLFSGLLRAEPSHALAVIFSLFRQLRRK